MITTKSYLETEIAKACKSNDLKRWNMLRIKLEEFLLWEAGDAKRRLEILQSHIQFQSVLSNIRLKNLKANR